jgi:putative DNA primase/helicase
MIQVMKLRKFVPKDSETGEEVGYFKAVKGLSYPSLKDCFSNIEQDLKDNIGEKERFNLFYTVAHHLEGKRTKASWQAQDIIPFDLDGIDLNQIDLYPPIVAKVLNVDLEKTAVVYTGNGCHVLVQVPLIKDKDFIKDKKAGYKKLLDEIELECLKVHLPLDKDSTAWDYARILRLPFTRNEKIKEGQIVIKEARLIKNNLEEQNVNIESIAKVDLELTMSRGSFPLPDGKTIVQKCDFFKWLAEKPDEVHEPHAYAMLSISGYFQDDQKKSRELWEKFSSPSINSKELEEFTMQALNASGPRTCKGIEQIFDGCKTCPNYNKVTSPILIKDEKFIGSKHCGFSLKGPRGGVIRQYGDMLLHFDNTYKHKSVGAIGKVYLWNETHYKITDETFIKNFAQINFEPLAKSEEKREFLHLIKDTEYTDVTFLENEKCKDKVNLLNGVLDLRNGLVTSHDPNYEFLYCLPFDYDPNATCPRWDEFISDVTLGRQCLQDILHEYLGYIISGSNYKYQKSLILDGSGNNGKTTFLKVMKKLVGSTNISNLSLDSLQNSVFASAGLHGKLCNISEEEPPKTFRESNGAFKNLTGDGVVNAQYKYGNPFEFENKAKVIITYNEMPYINDTTKGMLRRLMITPWEFDISKNPDKKDPDIEYKLYEELSGIFNKCLEGWKRLEEQKGFTKSVYVDKKVNEVHEYSDVVFRFLNQCVQKTGDESDKIESKIMYNAYCNYHDSEGGKKLTTNSFGRRMKKEGIESYKTNGLKMFQGVRNNPKAQPF